MNRLSLAARKTSHGVCVLHLNPVRDIQLDPSSFFCLGQHEAERNTVVAGAHNTPPARKSTAGHRPHPSLFFAELWSTLFPGTSAAGSKDTSRLR